MFSIHHATTNPKAYADTQSHQSSKESLGTGLSTKFVPSLIADLSKTTPFNYSRPKDNGLLHHRWSIPTTFPSYSSRLPLIVQPPQNVTLVGLLQFLITPPLTAQPSQNITWLDYSNF
jgi:hypothetical protein